MTQVHKPTEQAAAEQVRVTCVHSVHTILQATVTGTWLVFASPCRRSINCNYAIHLSAQAAQKTASVGVSNQFKMFAEVP